VSELLRDDSQVTTKPGRADSQAAAALGISQRERFTGSGMPKPRRRSKSAWKVQGGALGFILDHKLVLGVLAVSTVLLMGSFLDWHNAAIGVFAFIGFGVAVGAWRSQWFGDSLMKAAEDWRWLEMWIGGGSLLLLAVWASYIFLMPVYLLISAGIERGFNATLWAAVVGLLLLWAISVAYCVGMGAMSRRFGFFKVAGWNYLVNPILVAILVLCLADHVHNLPPTVRSALARQTPSESLDSAEHTVHVVRPGVQVRNRTAP
jgi:hypothetical protein